MKKTILLIPALVAAVYIALMFTGSESLGRISGTVYLFVSTAAFFWAAVRVFVKAGKLGDKDALFTGALGLGIHAIGTVYYFAHGVFAGTSYGLIVSDLSDAASYLFFLSTLVLLILPPFHLEKIFRVGVNVVCALSILAVIYAVISNNAPLLQITVAITALVCIALSVYLLKSSFRFKQLKMAKLFAASMIILGIVDIVFYLGLFTGVFLVGELPHQILLALYMPLFVFISEGLISLRRESV